MAAKDKLGGASEAESAFQTTGSLSSRRDVENEAGPIFPVSRRGRIIATLVATAVFMGAAIGAVASARGSNPTEKQINDIVHSYQIKNAPPPTRR